MDTRKIAMGMVMTMFDNYPDVVTVKELCHMLQIGKNTTGLRNANIMLPTKKI